MRFSIKYNRVVRYCLVAFVINDRGRLRFGEIIQNNYKEKCLIF